MKLSLEIISPENGINFETIDSVLFQVNEEGPMLVLPQHAPFLGEIIAQNIEVNINATKQIIKIAEGFVKIIAIGKDRFCKIVTRHIY